MNTAAISITRINSFEEQSWCAQLMAGSEPWISLKRTFSDGLALMQVTDGGMEAYIAKSGEINLGFGGQQGEGYWQFVDGFCGAKNF